MRVAIAKFPGSFGAEELLYVYEKKLGTKPYIVWHQEESLGNPDLLVLPGGASFGDYLRPGALTMGSPILDAVRRHVKSGAVTLGIGNGFQILCEMRLLPGVLLENLSQQFLSRKVFLSVQNNSTPFTKSLELESVLELPLACRWGRFYGDKRTIRDLEEEGSVVFRFCDREGEVDEERPFNGSLNAIAGICSRDRKTLGLICRPERASEPLLGGEDGLKILLPS